MLLGLIAVTDTYLSHLPSLSGPELLLQSHFSSEQVMQYDLGALISVESELITAVVCIH